ncbi:OLC1v1036549C1 [Oldenlandia corymbosa var. corymbosa]|uniref:OLC1v1036549C1 n=1 Tax=Oldenlandia corymbosa var. corymbosa TaxID=529605 RepID=A0AAV1CXM0_OLDCO|nr:OLC1v1036549C1 [Oldenlandia corymbosa var. corymbosa]
MKYADEKKSKHGMLRDNVPWTSISNKLTTRAQHSCCHKWYRQLTSPMVMKGDWKDSDDYRLIDKLFQLDSTCFDDVDWDDLLEHRSGVSCQKRWKEMVRHMSESSKKTFADQVRFWQSDMVRSYLKLEKYGKANPMFPSVSVPP